MKFLPAAVIAIGCCLSWPQAALAEQVYLVIFAAKDSHTSGAITAMSLPMESVDQCHAAGLKLQSNNASRGNIRDVINNFKIGYDCIVGGK